MIALNLGTVDEILGKICAVSWDLSLLQRVHTFSVFVMRISTPLMHARSSLSINLSKKIAPNKGKAKPELIRLSDPFASMSFRSSVRSLSIFILKIEMYKYRLNY